MSDPVVDSARGSRFEGIAFSFCKAATVALVFQNFALPAAALLCAVFFVLAVYFGKKETKCVLRYPLFIAGFWVVVAAVWFVFYLR
ncbi:MAG: hypothetical protein M3R13_01670 [Armatimonadota bacterium]|nr:hypothetical protein [Armatimonadota bacterium]